MRRDSALLHSGNREGDFHSVQAVRMRMDARGDGFPAFLSAAREPPATRTNRQGRQEPGAFAHGRSLVVKATLKLNWTV